MKYSSTVRPSRKFERIGFSMMSPEGLAMRPRTPHTWRDTSWSLWALSGIYLVFAALCAFAVGGYIAGRMRARVSADSGEIEGSDGMHGLITWALAVVIA